MLGGVSPKNKEHPRTIVVARGQSRATVWCSLSKWQSQEEVCFSSRFDTFASYE